MINKIILSVIVGYCPRLSLRDILRRQSKTIHDNDKQNNIVGDCRLLSEVVVKRKTLNMVLFGLIRSPEGANKVSPR